MNGWAIFKNGIRQLMKKLLSLILSGILGVWLLTGCGKPPADSPAKAAADAPAVSNAPANAPVSAAAEPVTEGPPPGEKICFACAGKGTIKCLAPGCVDGMVDCPGACLKLDRGNWIHLDVPGHPPTDIWQKFYQADGSYMAYNQNHVGHVIQMQNGKAVDTGPCPLCGGTGKVPCSVCKGTGQETCLICGGKKFIPAAWTATDNPWLNRQPDLIRFTDGHVMFGKVVSTVGSDVTIKGRDGKWLHVDAANLVLKTAEASTNAM